jgi:hypothetical protein
VVDEDDAGAAGDGPAWFGHDGRACGHPRATLPSGREHSVMAFGCEAGEVDRAEKYHCAAVAGRIRRDIGRSPHTTAHADLRKPT